MVTRMLILLTLVLSVPSIPVNALVISGFFVPSIGLGYSAATLTPLSQGIPVYTAGDQLWVVSYQGPSTVQFLDASGKLVSSLTLSPMQPAFMHTFVGADNPGEWVLNFTTTSPPPFNHFALPVELSRPRIIVPQMIAVHVDSAGQLSLGFMANLGRAYDTSICLVGQNSLERVQIPIPGGLGTGQLLLSRNGNTTTILPDGRISSPFTFWFELHASRSYQEIANTSISRDTEEAASLSLPLSPGSSNQSVALLSTTAVREGRATIRAFFESSAGLQTFETPILIPDASTWEWLPGCTSSLGGIGSNFTASASLKVASSLWPRAIYLMYADSGVEAYSRIRIPVSPSVVNLVAAPWGTPVTDDGISVFPASTVVASAMGNSTIYFLSSSYPVFANLQVPGSILGRLVSIDYPYSLNSFQLDAGKISLKSLFNGGAVSDSSLILKYGNQTIATGKGSPIFYVPAGSYLLFASYRGINRSIGVAVANGNQTSVVIEFGTPVSRLDFLLMGTAAIGAIASGVLWVSLARGWKRAKFKFRKETYSVR